MEILEQEKANGTAKRKGQDSVNQQREKAGTFVEGAVAVTAEIQSRSKLDPFAPIHKSESHTASGNLTGYAIEIDTYDEDKPRELIGTVSPNYLLVPNRDFVDILREIGEASSFDFADQRQFWDGKRFFFSMVIENEEVYELLEPGNHTVLEEPDLFRFGIYGWNSYDGSRAAEVALFAERLVCKNTAISTQHFARHRFRHDQSANGHWREEVEQALSVVTQGPGKLHEFVQGLSRMQQLRVGHKELHALLGANGGPLSGLGDQDTGKLVRCFAEHEEPTVYGLFNALTYITWHTRMTQADFSKNDLGTTALLGYARKNVN